MSTFPVVGSRSTVVRLVGVAGPPLILAIAGVTHPPQLTPSTADHWTHLHLVLLPVFPLLALGPWLLAAGHPRLRIATALLGYVYAVFYSALDVLAGIGTGTLVAHGESPAAAALFAVGNQLSYVGVGAYLLSVVVVSVARIRHHGLPAVVGAVVMIVSAVSFLTSHIYWPRGVFTTVGLAIGGALLLLAGTRSSKVPLPDRATAV